MCRLRAGRVAVPPREAGTSAAAAGEGPEGWAFSKPSGVARAGPPKAGQLPCIVVEDARRVAQEPVPELPSFPILGLQHAFRGGGRHDTGDGSVCFPKLLYFLWATPLPEAAVSAREKRAGGRVVVLFDVRLAEDLGRRRPELWRSQELSLRGGGDGRAGPGASERPPP